MTYYDLAVIIPVVILVVGVAFAVLLVIVIYCWMKVHNSSINHEASTGNVFSTDTIPPSYSELSLGLPPSYSQIHCSMLCNTQSSDGISLEEQTANTEQVLARINHTESFTHRNGLEHTANSEQETGIHHTNLSVSLTGSEQTANIEQETSNISASMTGMEQTVNTE
ncbi:Hypothetical predicted protein [Mytilus galloprovincialis]|uniref:Uncharacterized protein n=1 Tax=Mytilus galloprovincialis TaxID=29158 RepID=A0A8B6GEA6_MYTGA|nr:Hypothetical predicted protein [Mytilus galloprovincialis]